MADKTYRGWRVTFYTGDTSHPYAYNIVLKVKVTAPCLADLHRLIDRIEGPQDYKCPKCGSSDVLISLPAWHKPTHDGQGSLEYDDSDWEADPMYWTCNSCEQGGRGTIAVYETP